jgi:uncharacterized membrane protein
MRAWLQYAWYQLTASLWFVPVLIMGGAAALSFLTLYLDTLLTVPILAAPGTGLRIGAEGSRALLATIAGSMITVASLAFSMTLVTLQLASSQLGPRLISRFVQDRINQTVLGTFLATFLYASWCCARSPARAKERSCRRSRPWSRSCSRSRAWAGSSTSFTTWPRSFRQRRWSPTSPS